MHNARLLALVAAEGETLDPDYAECSSASDRSASCCRSVALIVSSLLKTSLNNLKNLKEKQGVNSHNPYEAIM